jgi:hypothetical protein
MLLLVRHEPLANDDSLPLGPQHRLPVLVDVAPEPIRLAASVGAGQVPPPTAAAPTIRMASKGLFEQVRLIRPVA